MIVVRISCCFQILYILILFSKKKKIDRNTTTYGFTSNARCQNQKKESLDLFN